MMNNKTQNTRPKKGSVLSGNVTQWVMDTLKENNINIDEKRRFLSEPEARNIIRTQKANILQFAISARTLDYQITRVEENIKNEIRQHEQLIRSATERHKSLINRLNMELKNNIKKKKEFKPTLDVKKNQFKQLCIKHKDYNDNNYPFDFFDFPEFEIYGLSVKYRSHIINILNTLKDKLISEKQLATLDKEKYVNEKILIRFFTLRADSEMQIWTKTKNDWKLVNALADYRRAKSSAAAINHFNSKKAYIEKIKDKKCLGAIYTTIGGSYRDLNDVMTAIDLAKEAHNISPKSFQPCSLLGACYLDQYEYDSSSHWFNEAIKRGFTFTEVRHLIDEAYKKANKKQQYEIHKLRKVFDSKDNVNQKKKAKKAVKNK